MSLNTQWDSKQLQPLDLPYNRIQAELDTEPRLYSGNNTFCTLGGKIIKRPGTISSIGGSLSLRCDRLWIYETLDSPPRSYILGSFYHSGSSVWKIYYSDNGGNWTLVPNLRSIQSSNLPHEVVVSRGLAYIKSYPTVASGELLGTVVFDGTAGSVSTKPWGLLGPTTPTALIGATTRLSASIADTTTTSMNVVSGSGFPATPFDIQVDFEQMTVTNKGGGTNWTVTRSANGTEASTHDTNAIVIWRNWSTADHKLDVNWYWRYTYSYKTSTGQVSNRAPVQTNPDKLPSSTGPFFDLVPKFNYTGNSDTTNITKIIFHRTTDGGGTYYKLEEFNNPGSGTQTYIDDSLETGVSGGTYNDAVPDDVINTAEEAPSLTSNSPPPTVTSPKVVGTDVPDPSTPIASYAGRLFYGINNILFFSGNEEIKSGIPEECWPSGLKGNFFRFQYPVTNVQATTDCLYIFTLQAIYQLTGTSLESFSVRPIIENIGHPYGHSRAITKWNDVVAFLTHDFRIAIIQNSTGLIVSDELGSDLVDHMADNATNEFDIKYYGHLEKEFVIVSGHVKSTPTNSRQWVLDLKKSKGASNFEGFKVFWNTPWTVRSTAMVSGRVYGKVGRRLLFYIWNPTDSKGQLVEFDTTNSIGTDFYPATVDDDIGYDFIMDTGQFNVPGGNHVNSLRVPAVTPVAYGFVYDRTLYNGDSDPQNFYYLDDFWTTPVPVESKSAWRRQLSKGYKTTFCPINKSCQHFALRIQKLDSKELFEMQNLTVVFSPDSGA